MIRKAAYESVGGYRDAFYYAQDLDLWLRLAEAGPIGMVDEVLFQILVEPASVSGMRRVEQQELTKLIVRAALERRGGRTEAAILESARCIRPSKLTKRAKDVRSARGNYFIGACLRNSDLSAAVGYFKAANRHDPMMLRAYARRIECELRGWFR
jgi:hypothetical protein